MLGQEHTNVMGRQCGLEIFIGLNVDVFKIKPCIAEQLMSPRRFRRQQQFGELRNWGVGIVGWGIMGGWGRIHDWFVWVVCGDADVARGSAIVWQRYCGEEEELSKFVLC